MVLLESLVALSMTMSPERNLVACQTSTCNSDRREYIDITGSIQISDKTIKRIYGVRKFQQCFKTASMVLLKGYYLSYLSFGCKISDQDRAWEVKMEIICQSRIFRQQKLVLNGITWIENGTIFFIAWVTGCNYFSYLFTLRISCENYEHIAHREMMSNPLYLRTMHKERNSM